jgi:hypothetical protein
MKMINHSKFALKHKNSPFKLFLCQSANGQIGAPKEKISEPFGTSLLVP